jgi:two-component SAPR family response regulator
VVSGRTSAKLRKGMKCIVVDDEKIAREGLAEFIKEFDYLENLGLFANANLALEKLKTHSVDLIFLDIQMPLLSGLEFARIVADKQIMIIFTTAHLEYALDGYRVNSVGYLLKPIFFKDFELAVQKAKKMYDSIHRSEVEYDPLFLKEDGMLVKVYPTQVMYIKGTAKLR